MEVMNMDLKDERQAKLELQATVSQLELEVKKLKADLHVSSAHRYTMGTVLCALLEH